MEMTGRMTFVCNLLGSSNKDLFFFISDEESMQFDVGFQR